MSLNQESMTVAFKSWLQSKEFYTGEIGDAKFSNWDGIALKAGAILAKIAIKASTKAIFKLEQGPKVPLSTKFSSAKDAEKAETQLASLRREFNFVGFRTKWSSPVLVLGLFSDSLSTSEVHSLFSRLPQQVGSLKKYGYDGNLYSLFSTKLLLVYLKSEVYESHCNELLSHGTKIHEPVDTVLRTCFIDMKGKQIQWSQRVGILGKKKSSSTSSDKKELFGKNDLLQILESMV